jgi:hypothetical protein
VRAKLDVHIVMDNYGTHKTKLIRNWFARINQVERFFALLTERITDRPVLYVVIHNRTCCKSDRLIAERRQNLFVPQ